MVLFISIIAYIYSLTFTPHGRMDWRQAAYAKLFSVVLKPGTKDILGLIKQEVDNIKPETILPTVASFKALKITTDSLPVYVYRANNLPSNAPIIIYYHGGGFVIPLVTDGHVFARRYANAFNAIIVAVDYRVAPAHPYPAAVDDCYRTFKWVVENANSLGGNPNKIAVIGESAGGNLAAVVSQQAQKEGYSNIKHQTLFCPSVDIAHVYSYPANQRLQQGYILDKTFMDFFFDSYLPQRQVAFETNASPLLQENMAGLPPAFVITAEFDPLRDEGVAYYQKLQKAGVSVKYKDMVGCLHVVQGPLMDEVHEDLNKEIALELKKAFQ